MPYCNLQSRFVKPDRIFHAIDFKALSTSPILPLHKLCIFFRCLFTHKIIENEYSQEDEGGNEHGTDISSQRGLSVSESDNPGDRGTDWEIRNAAEDISEGTQEQPVSEPVTDRETVIVCDMYEVHFFLPFQRIKSAS